MASNTSVQFGDMGLPSASTAFSLNEDVFVAKYSAAGTYQWARSGGGTNDDTGYGLATDAAGSVYVMGGAINAATSATSPASALAVQFGGVGLPSASTNTTANTDVFVAKYYAGGAYQWARAAGGTGYDQGYALAIDGSGSLYVAGIANPTATFDAATLAGAPDSFINFLARLAPLGGTLATQAGAVCPGLALYPNPARGSAAVAGLPAGASVAVYDALGRRVGLAVADANGTAHLQLPSGLAPGVYVVRGGQAVRLAVE